MNLQINAGLQSWLVQRLSAVYLALFLLYCLLSWAVEPIHSYAQWHAWVAQPMRNVFLILFAVAVLVHAWVGGRDIVLDYVKPWWSRFLALTLLGVSLLTLAIWWFRVLLTLVPL